jgi:rhamnosyltransferase subunit B
VNVLIIAIGSHGDVHPFVGIATTLKSRGHRVKFIASGYYADLAAAVGLDFVPLGTAEEFLSGTRNPDLWHPFKGIGIVGKMTGELIGPVYQAILDHAAPGQTVLVYSTLAFGARLALETLRLPGVSVHLQPTIFRSIYDLPAVQGGWLLRLLPRPMKRLVHYLADVLVLNPVFGKPLNEFRARLNLPPIRGGIRDWYHSPQRTLGLFPAWYGPPQPDWPKQAALTGFMLYDEKEVTPLSPELEKFLVEGSPPIVFTPGSAMIFGQAFFAAAVDACRRLGRRGVLLTRHAEQIPSALPAEVIHVPYAPFSRILPRSAAVVHHGGIGSTAQGMACGVPQLLMPMGFDQPDNAQRIQRLGVGDWLSPKKFTGPAVAAKLRGLIDSPSVAAACREVAARIATEENAATLTAQYIEELAPAEPAAIT